MQAQINTTNMAVAAALVLGTSSVASATDWDLDPAHTASQFSVRHMMVSTVRGQFGKTTGSIHLDEKDPSKTVVNVTIDATTIDTRMAKRDADLKGELFFDVAKFPTLTFKSTSVEGLADGAYKVTGDLTMHGVTHPVVLNVESFSGPVKNPWGKTIRGVSATGTLNRKDWGLTWNKAIEAGGVVVGEEVKLIIDAEMIQAG